jgi:hypothetical protein
MIKANWERCPRRHASEAQHLLDCEPAADPEPDGAMLAAVRKDLAGINLAEVPGGHTYAAIALRLAGVIDKRPADDGPSVTAKLADQLGKAMAALTRKAGGDDDGFDQWEDNLSTPVRE